MPDVDSPATFEVRAPAPRVALIAVRGELTAAAEEPLMEAYHRASEDTRAIVIDFTDLEYMNSTGIGLLVTLLVRAQRQRQQLVAFGLSDHYRQIFSLTRLDEAITIADDQASALSGI